MNVPNGSIERALSRVIELRRTVAGRAGSSDFTLRLRSYADVESLAQGFGMQWVSLGSGESQSLFGSALSADEADRLMEACDQLRFRLLAVALAGNAKQMIGDSQNPARAEMGPIINAPGGITYAAVGKAAVVLLPECLTGSQDDNLARGFLEVSESPACANRHWILDFSAVKELKSARIFALIRDYRDLLAARGGYALTILWMRCTLLREASHAKACELLKLKKMGEHFFSDEIFAAAG